MDILSKIEDVKAQIKSYKSQGKIIGFVPTMGNLHKGHLQLVSQAINTCDVVVSSIFVNPLQFDKQADLKAYPRTLEDDSNSLRDLGVKLIFTPTPEIMYPKGLDNQAVVEVLPLSNMLEGKLRPGHFRGVATVVNKLFNIIQPDYAFFGEKDFQQLAIIKQMVKDLSLDVIIKNVPIVRESDGLAMSSRNNYLTENERKIAPSLYQTMLWIKQQLLENNRTDYAKILEQANVKLEEKSFKRDELFLRDAKNLEEISQDTTHIVILMSAHLGKARLIDNMVISLS